MTVVEILLAVGGLIGGLALSVLFWFVTTHFLVPELVFSTGISKDLDVEPGRAVYRVKVKNAGRRSIIDISMRVRIIAPKYSIRRQASGANTAIEVPLDNNHLFILGPNSSRIVWLELDGIEDILQYLDPTIADKVKERRDGALEGLLTIRDDIYLYVQALAYDELSGARKYYGSKRYVASDIKRGKFRGLDIVREVPSDSTVPGETTA